MLKRSLLLKIYEAANMQRWNDQIRTIEITELDKQAHKMVAAYVLGKCEEDCGNKEIDWIEIIEAGFFEYLQRIILTDLKPPLFYEIKQNREKYARLNQWVYKRIYPVIKDLGEAFCLRFKNYIMENSYEREDKSSSVANDNGKEGKPSSYINSYIKDSNIKDINKKIVGAAHFYITKWEFNIIQRFNPKGYQVAEIAKSIEKEQEKYNSIAGVKRFLSSKELLAFIDICGQLRFQIRWSHLYRVPKTSVLGHMLIVAIFSYLFSYLNGSRRKKIVNNYFTGLFHDLPEVLTRDIINPVKKSVEGLDEIIKEYERSEMDKRIYKLLPAGWHDEIRMFTEKEFENTEIRDGQLVKAADDLAAFIEAYLSVENGIQNENLAEAMHNLKEKYKNKVISSVDFEGIYGEFIS
jgi:putative hydrolase of HD superfamily